MDDLEAYERQLVLTVLSQWRGALENVMLSEEPQASVIEGMALSDVLGGVVRKLGGDPSLDDFGASQFGPPGWFTG